MKNKIDTSVPVLEPEEQEDEEQEAMLYEEQDNVHSIGADFSQEAFTPVFTVAPDIEQQSTEGSNVHVPTTEEQKNVLEKMYARFGIAAKTLLTDEAQELSPELNTRVNRTSLMAARIFASVSMWGWSIFGIEYQIVAPSVEQSQKMIEPLMRITARHAPIVGNISPDVDDVIEAGTAISDYALYAMATMQQIREDKLAENGRYNGNGQIRNRAYEDKARFNGNSARPDDFSGFTTNSDEPIKTPGNGQYTNTTDHLTENERYNRDMLSALRTREYETRARRAGKF